MTLQEYRRRRVTRKNPQWVLMRTRPAAIAVAAVVLFLLIFSAGIPCQASQKKTKATVAVMDFKLAQKVTPGMQRLVKTSLITEKLKTALVETHKFQILERQDVDMLLKEIKFANSRVSDRRQGPRRGKFRGARYIVTGEISLLEAKQYTRPIPSTNRYNLITTGTIICDVRVIDAEKSAIVTASNVEASNSQRNFTTSPQAGAVDDLFMEDLQRALVQKIADKIIQSVFPLKVVDIDGDTVYLNRGEGSGLAPGARLIIYKRGKEIIDPDTGERLGTSERPVATVEITQVLPKMSVARVIDSHDQILSGMAARMPAEKSH